ncbi:hypothetical protein Tco_1171514 [Tanacetum coccineum]
MVWIKWDNILASHDKGRLGIGSLKAFNLALLKKWRWRLVTFSDSLWAHMVKAIHGDDTRMKLKGCKVSGNSPLSTRYNRLFHLDANPNCMLADRLSQDTWTWNWKRHLGSRNEESLEILKTEICRVQVNDCPDSWHWNGGDDGVFSMSATRMHVDNCILPSLSPSTRWSKILPCKICFNGSKIGDHLRIIKIVFMLYPRRLYGSCGEVEKLNVGILG